MNCLAPEMVRARPFLRGRLVAEGVWKKGRNADGYEYDNQPWEKEAYRLEKELFTSVSLGTCHSTIDKWHSKRPRMKKLTVVYRSNAFGCEY